MTPLGGHDRLWGAGGGGGQGGSCVDGCCGCGCRVGGVHRCGLLCLKVIVSVLVAGWPPAGVNRTRTRILRLRPGAFARVLALVLVSLTLNVAVPGRLMVAFAGWVPLPELSSLPGSGTRILSVATVPVTDRLVMAKWLSGSRKIAIAIVLVRWPQSAVSARVPEASWGMTIRNPDAVHWEGSSEPSPSVTRPPTPRPWPVIAICSPGLGCLLKASSRGDGPHP